ncbi:arylsulfatase [Actinospongicola halichondriae]|uniref:arylsulfatase n=1 Tax=Actinospongicola halichondriae TaxID=3236844 RepID=UPI003D549D41
MAAAEPRPEWPSTTLPTPGDTPNVLVVLFDDVGFSDFGCYGSEIATPAIDAIAARGLRYSGFHTTAMCSTTRAALLTGRNHHNVGVGCLANFDSGYPGYRGKIARSAGTVAELVKPYGYRSYLTGKWHVTPLTETGPTGPYDGWPLQRGFDRFYGFLDAETDQYAPELVYDNHHVDPPGTFEDGYHLSIDVVDKAIEFLKDHRAGAPDAPWLTWVAFGACHAPHQAPREIIDHYEPIFAKGWDVTRQERLDRQIEMGVVPAGTRLPPRNDNVKAWDEHRADEQRVFTRLQAAYAAMLDHADRQIARLMAFLEDSGMADDTLVLVLSDNGASQEGGPAGFVNAMGPFNAQPESMDDKLARLDDIGGPGTHSNFPWGWSMAANTPLKRYKQNTHGGGIRDPLVVSWPAGIAARGEVRDQFCHANDVVPTLLDVFGLDLPASIAGVEQQPLDGASFRATFASPDAPPPKSTQYFEMFGHRGVWHDGWKAVAYHPPYKAFEDDRWELYHLDADFSEVHDLAADEPERLAALQELWWEQARANKVLPLDDRFAERFAENAERHRGGRTHYEFWAGMGHVPSDAAPDLRSRSYRITAEVLEAGEGVLLAHGDETSGYSLYVKDGRLVHDLSVGGHHQVVTSDRPVPEGPSTLGFSLDREAAYGGAAKGIGTLWIDGDACGTFETDRIFVVTISWSGLDIGRDRVSPVSDYAAPFAFTGSLRRVTVDLVDDQELDHEAVGRAETARE